MKITAKQLRNFIVEEIDYLHKKDSVLGSNLTEIMGIDPISLVSGPLSPLSKLVGGKKNLKLVANKLTSLIKMSAKMYAALPFVVREMNKSGALQAIWKKNIASGSDVAALAVAKKLAERLRNV